MADITTNTPSQLTEGPSGSALPASAKSKTTKRDQLLKLLTRARGATITQIEALLNWQPHTIRAAISRLRADGLEITLDKSGASPRYRAVPGDAS